MTIGISKDSLEKKLISAEKLKEWNSVALLNMIITQCKELDPWLPVENAPAEQFLLVLLDNGDIHKAKKCMPFCTWLTPSFFEIDRPTHYKKLPEDPKE